MTAAEARKQQWDSLKGQPLQRLKYVFTYYWPAILGVLCVVIFLTTWIYGIATKKEVALGGHLINAAVVQDNTGDITQAFMEHQQIDAEKYTFNLSYDAHLSSGTPDTALVAMEALVARIAVGELQFLVSDLENYPIMSAYYADLRNVLSQQQLEQWKDRLVYVEKEALDLLTSDVVDKDIVLPKYYLSAEGLKDPLPIGIRLSDSSCLMDYYKFPKGEVIFGFVHNITETENAIAFLEYIME